MKNCLKVFQNLTAGSVKGAILFADRQPFCFWTDRYGLQSLQAQFTDR